MSNLLAMPLVLLSIETGNNEDWVDSLLFVIDDGSGDPSNMPQLDISGITFEMEVRRSAGDPEVIVAASTGSGTLKVGEAPNFGHLLWNVLEPDMRRIRADSYVADVIGRDGVNIRRVVTIDPLVVVDGITRQPVNRRVIVQVAA